MPRRLPRSLVFRLTAIFSLVGMGLIWGMGFFLISSLRSATHAQVEMEVLRIERAILIATAVVPLLGALLAWFLARLGLAPLRPLARQVGAIRPENLNLRLDPQAMCLELAPLARSLNETLGRLELAFQRLSDLNAELAHELRTPIHALQLEAESLLNRKELPPAAAEALVGMMETLTHMATVVEQMLFLSRVEEAQPLDRTPLDAGDLLRLAAAPYECLAEEANVTLRIEAPPGLALFGNATLLRRALHNLLANGIRHSPRGGTLTLRAFVTDGGGAALEVRDEGPGIPPHVIAQIGRRFLRSESSRTPALGGSGLGLAIVQRISLLHGGTLAFETVDGQGTVIQIKLPGF